MKNFLLKYKKIIIVLTSIILFIGILFGGFAIYASFYYHANSELINSFINDTEVNKNIISKNTTVYQKEETDIGFIFYPGGKVEHTAYEPLMYLLADQDITCFLIEMPFNLAIFNINAADSIIDSYSNINHWYIGGHSLGGAMASSFALKNNDIDGLILLGAYSTGDLSNKNIEVLSIYGSEDKVLNKEKYNECKANLPSDYQEIILEGGCHSYFGMYGMQDGDGIPSLTNEEQLNLTSTYIKEFINK